MYFRRFYGGLSNFGDFFTHFLVIAFTLIDNVYSVLSIYNLLFGLPFDLYSLSCIEEGELFVKAITL